MSVPQSLRNDTATAVLEIVWDANTKQLLGNVELRAQCQCAECKSLIKAGEKLTVLPQTVITDIKLVGSYAAQFFFSDGHSRGIYPWTYLKTLGTREVEKGK
jgi:DUF971 family protein